MESRKKRKNRKCCYGGDGLFRRKWEPLTIGGSMQRRRGHHTQKQGRVCSDVTLIEILSNECLREI